MIKSRGYAALNAKDPLQPFHFERREVGENDILIEILYCGICHSDIHMARNEWRASHYPMVPGHEIVGRVAKVGTNVKNFKVGAFAGVGCLVNSCRTCVRCKEGTEQYCENDSTLTYNSQEDDGKYTYGGYSNCIVVNQDFALHISEKVDLARTAPLLCAGVTTYYPLKYWKAGPGQKVGIVGLGGLGHMGIQLARAMGAQVTLFTTSANKASDALRLGAHEAVISKNPAEMTQQLNSFDLILDTVSGDHDVTALLNCLKHDGVMVMIGLPENPQSVDLSPLVLSHRKLVGSVIGGIAETQEMLDFCEKHNILSEIEMIPAQKINDAYERILNSDVKYRFVIDMSSL